MGNAAGGEAHGDLKVAKNKFDEAELIEAELLYAQMQVDAAFNQLWAYNLLSLWLSCSICDSRLKLA